MLINDITQRLERSSLRDDDATSSTSVGLHSSNAKNDLILKGAAACSDNSNMNSASSTAFPSPLVRGSGLRLSLPFNSATCGPKMSNILQSANLELPGPRAALDNDIDMDELPLKRRHLSWAAADFRMHSGISVVARRSESNRPTVDCPESNIELVKPVPVRPVLANCGSRGDSRDDFGISSSKHTSFSPSIPRPSSASSGIFDLDTSSECSKRSGDKLDRSASNGWSSSADERRRSDEESSRQLATTAAAAASSSPPRGHRSYVRHCRGAHSKLSSSGFFSLAHRSSDYHDDSCRDHGAGATAHNPLDVPGCTVSSSPSNKGNMSSSWWRSAPDLVSEGGHFRTGAEDESDCCRRNQRKRNLSGRLQARPSIDLFKNVTDDDSYSSCCGESEPVTDGACSENNDNSYCDVEFRASHSSGKASSSRYSSERKGLETEDDYETEDSDDTNSLAASSRSTAATFSIMGASSGLDTESTPPVTVVRSLSYPWLQGHDIDGYQHRSKPCEQMHRRSVTGGHRTGRSANVVPALIEDGLRTIVGSPADTIAAVVSLVCPVRSSNSSFSAASPTINLLSLVADTIKLDSVVSGQFVDKKQPPSKLIIGDDNDKVHQIGPGESLNHPDSTLVNSREIIEPPLDKQLLDAPPQLIDGPVLFLARTYNFQNELDIDLIEQN